MLSTLPSLSYFLPKSLWASLLVATFALSSSISTSYQHAPLWWILACSLICFTHPMDLTVSNSTSLSPNQRHREQRRGQFGWWKYFGWQELWSYINRHYGQKNWRQCHRRKNGSKSWSKFNWTRWRKRWKWRRKRTKANLLQCEAWKWKSHICDQTKWKFWIK